MAQINKYALPQQGLTTDAPYAGPVNSDYARFQLLPNSQKRDYMPTNTSLFAINDLNKSVNSANPNYDSRAEWDNIAYKARLNGKSPNYSVESSSAIMPSDGLGVSTEKKSLFDYNPEASSSGSTTTTKAVSNSKPKVKSTRRRDPMAEWAEEDIANNGLKDKYKAQYESEVAANAKIYPTGSSAKKTNGLNYTPDDDSTQTGTQRGRR